MTRVGVTRGPGSPQIPRNRPSAAVSPSQALLGLHSALQALRILPRDGVVGSVTSTDPPVATAHVVDPHPLDRHDARSWLADQLLEPTKLVFAVVIAESLSEYSPVVTSPWHSRHYVATLALVGVYLTTIWSWRGWHAAHLKSPYKIAHDRLARGETFRFYTDLSIVIAYAYTLFQVEPLMKEPTTDLVWLLLGYPIIVCLYIVENSFRVFVYGSDERRRIPLGITLALHLAVMVAYIVIRRHVHSTNGLLHLNAIVLVVAIVVMWSYRETNKHYKDKWMKKAAA
jgi:hypothetical protein